MTSTRVQLYMGAAGYQDVYDFIKMLWVVSHDGFHVEAGDTRSDS